jgi:hypothetical protein
MVQIDIPIAFIISQLTIDIGKDIIKAKAKEEKGAKPKIYYQYLARCLLVAGLVIAPAGGYLLAGWPGWESQYWWWRFEQPMYSNMNALLPALFTFTIVLGGYLGFELGYRLVVSDRERYLKPIYIGLLALTSGTVLLGWPAPVRAHQWHRVAWMAGTGSRGHVGGVCHQPCRYGLPLGQLAGIFYRLAGRYRFFLGCLCFLPNNAGKGSKSLFPNLWKPGKIKGGDHVEYTSGYLSESN